MVIAKMLLARCCSLHHFSAALGENTPTASACVCVCAHGGNPLDPHLINRFLVFKSATGNRGAGRHCTARCLSFRGRCISALPGGHASVAPHCPCGPAASGDTWGNAVCVTGTSGGGRGHQGGDGVPRGLQKGKAAATHVKFRGIFQRLLPSFLPTTGTTC